ncbi:orotidine-5'-phosphate decarboxylase [candidate division WOR-3 bacterium]|nr:orotidine-5'-phosphate decarboxylase [candidate division WOR-3 bacterium]
MTELIVAANLPSLAELAAFVKKTSGHLNWYKIDAGLYTKTGPDAIKLIKDEGKKVFLDLKFHDIPSTVARAAACCIELGVDMFNVHAMGGFAMMEAVVKETWSFHKGVPLILGVTILTSIDEAAFRDLFGSPSNNLDEHVLLLAQLAKSAGLSGVVASAQEIKKIKKVCGDDFVVVSPGIRLPDEDAGDQMRVDTPAGAAAAGADFIVVGRSIVHADDPVAVIERYKSELKGESG